VKILDFGIAKLSATGSDGPSFKPAATEPGMVLGTVGYMSPEQVRGEPVDPRTDIFALGTIIYEMLTGHRAFKRDSSIETLSAILKEEPPELLEVNPNIPSALDRLVRRCLEKDRQQRFQSARDLAFNLETMTSFSSHGTMSGISQSHNPAGVTPAVRTSPGTVVNPTSASIAPESATCRGWTGRSSRISRATGGASSSTRRVRAAAAAAESICARSTRPRPCTSATDTATRSRPTANGSSRTTAPS